MKKVRNSAIFLFLLLTMTMNVMASSATSPTRTLDNKYNLVWTQDAYLPQLNVSDLGLKGPQDMAIDKNDHIYIADRDNRRVVVYDITTDTLVRVISHPVLKGPTGIYLADNGDIYVADPAASTIVRFDILGNYIEQFDRPTTASFGETPYKPAKVAVDNRGNLYIQSEGVYNGIIQMSSSGEFLGYFTSNKVQLNFVQMLQDLFFTEAQKATLTNRVPVTFSNVYLDTDGVVYSTTMGSNMHGLKKHNTAGQDMLSARFIWGATDFSDITVDKDGIIYATSKSGQIFVYTNDGQFIFFFGSRYGEADIAGLFSSLVSIAIDSQGRIWTLDGEKSFLQSFQPTEYSQSIYAATKLFSEGKYDEATVIWNGVLRLNQMSVVAHNGIGMNLLYQQEYEEAMLHFKVSGNRYSFSQAFWEVRNSWLQSNLTVILGSLIGVMLLISLTRPFRKKNKTLGKIHNAEHRFLKFRFVSDCLLFLRVMRHPIDAFYDIKAKKAGSLISSLVVYVAVFVIFLWYTLGKGFIYQYLQIEDIDLNAVIIGFFSLTMLFVLCNYLVSSINDGEGGFFDLFKMMAYSFGPMMIGYVLIIGLSYVLTTNEAFFLQVIEQVAILWTGINLFLGIQEIHNYETKAAFKSVVMTILFMMLIAIILLIVILMTEQVYMFFEAVFKEAWRNAIS